MKLPRLTFYLGSILFALIATNVNAAIISISGYTNFNLGNRWVYQQSAFPGLWTLEANSFASRNGLDVVLLQEYDSSGLKNDQHFYQRDFSSGLRLVGGLNDFGQASEKTFFYEPPLPQMLADFSTGQIYSGTTTRTDFPAIDITYEYIFDFETVTVPAGLFADSLRVTERLSNPALGTFEQTLWFSCGTGLVKRIQDDGNVWQLSTFSGTTTDCGASTVPEPRMFPLFLVAFGALVCVKIRRCK